MQLDMLLTASAVPCTNVQTCTMCYYGVVQDDIDPDVAATLQANAERLKKLQANTVVLMLDAKVRLVYIVLLLF